MRTDLSSLTIADVWFRTHRPIIAAALAAAGSVAAVAAQLTVVSALAEGAVGVPVSAPVYAAGVAAVGFWMVIRPRSRPVRTAAMVGVAAGCALVLPIRLSTFPTFSPAGMTACGVAVGSALLLAAIGLLQRPYRRFECEPVVALARNPFVQPTVLAAVLGERWARVVCVGESQRPGSRAALPAGWGLIEEQR